MAADTVRIVRFHTLGGPEVLQLDELPLPEPGKGEVRLRVKAIGLNRAEALFRQGRYVERPALPSKIGYEASGIVEAVGPGVETGWVGKAASVVPSFSMNNHGTNGEIAILPASALVENPGNLSHEQAASLWMAYMTAYGPLVTYGKVHPGDIVIITAASSSVGLAAIEIVKREGAVSIAATRTSKKKPDLIAVGADYVVATQEENLVSRVKEITGGKGARVILDAVAGPDFKPLALAAANRGTIYWYGLLGGEPTPFPAGWVIHKSLTIRGFVVGEILGVPELRRVAEKYIVDNLRARHFMPRVARTFPLDQVVEAHRFLESNQQIGKVVITVT